jgi:hypothetical protein
MSAKVTSAIKAALFLFVFLILLVGGIGAQWLPGGNAVIGIKALGIMVAFISIVIGPLWLSGGSYILKLAIESIGKNDIKRARFYLISRSWMIFPLPKYAEIVQMLRCFCLDQNADPAISFPEFSKFFVKDDFNLYMLTEEGKNNLIAKVNTGWFTGKVFKSPNYLKLIMRLVVVVAAIRILIALIDFLMRHHH